MTTYSKERLLKNFVTTAKKYAKETGSSEYCMTRNYFRKHSSIGYGYYDHYWDNYQALKLAGFPNYKEDIQSLASVRSHAIGRATPKQKRFIVTSVVEGAPVNDKFLKAIRYYCDVTNATPVFLWSKGLRKGDKFNDATLRKVAPLYTTFVFSNKLVAQDLCVRAQQKDPLSGLDYLATGEASLIIAATKHAYRSLPRPMDKVPHSLWATATVSEPNYKETATDSIASISNTLGALIVEIESPTRFYIRPVTFVKDGFVDLGVKYTGTSAKKVKCLAAVLGDLHIPEEDPDFVAGAIDQINTLKAERVFIHDLLSINSVNHHNLHEYLTRAKMPTTNLNSELKLCKELVNKYTKQIHKKANIYIVASNHDAFIRKWLNTGEFIKDTQNARIGAEFFLKCLDGINPVEEYLNNPRLTFLKARQSTTVAGWECGFHGHAGSGGSHGSLSNFAKTFKKIIVAHHHAPGISKGAIQVGTLSKLNLPYLSGGTTAWLPASAYIYEDGSAQLITHIDKKWRL